MYRPKNPVRLVVDGLPAHKNAVVKEYVASTQGKLTLHFLPGYAPDLNSDELVWSHAKRTGVARWPLKAGEKLQVRVNDQMKSIAANRPLVKSFFRHPSVSGCQHARLPELDIQLGSYVNKVRSTVTDEHPPV